MDKRIIYKKVQPFNNTFENEYYKKIPCSEGISNLNESGTKTISYNQTHTMANLHESMIMKNVNLLILIQQ